MDKVLSENGEYAFIVKAQNSQKIIANQKALKIFGDNDWQQQAVEWFTANPLEIKCLKKINGQMIYLFIQKSPVAIGSNEVLLLFPLDQYPGEVKKKNRFLLELMINNTKNLILVTDMQLRIVFANKPLEDQSYPILGHSPLDLTSPASRRTVFETVKKVRNTGRVHTYVGYAPHLDMTEHCFSCEVGAIFHKGKQIGYSWFIVDITEQEYTAREKHLLEKAIDQSADLIVITDPNGIVEYVNSAFEKITLYRKEDVLGKSTSILKSGRHSPEFYQQMWNTIQLGKTWKGRFINRKKSGELFYDETTISPVMDEYGNISKFIAAKKDVTDKIREESKRKESQKLEAIGQLAGGIAHDFNNMLMVILGHCDFLEKRMRNTNQETTGIESIKSTCTKASELVKQLLTFSRRKIADLQIFDLNGTMAEAIKMLRWTLPENIDIRSNLYHNPLYIKGNKSQLEQIIFNLAVNARDAMPVGGKLTLSTDIDEKKSEAVIRVGDTGTGIDPKLKNKIFEPFFTTKEVGKGTGLGLSTTYGIVQQHNGIIAVKNNQSSGCTFRIRFPLSKTPLTDPEPKFTPDKSKENVRGRVLIVEDQNEIRSILCQYLIHHGHEVEAASNGEQVISTFGLNFKGFDLLISDIIMPKMNGNELFNKIGHNFPCGVLFISGYYNIREISHLPLGVRQRLLTKPFTREKLLEEVHSMLCHSHSELTEYG